jgi:hypothetical protein
MRQQQACSVSQSQENAWSTPTAYLQSSVVGQKAMVASPLTTLAQFHQAAAKPGQPFQANGFGKDAYSPSVMHHP